jgi:hypothetical protein
MPLSSEAAADSEGSSPSTPSRGGTSVSPQRSRSAHRQRLRNCWRTRIRSLRCSDSRRPRANRLQHSRRHHYRHLRHLRPAAAMLVPRRRRRGLLRRLRGRAQGGLYTILLQRLTFPSTPPRASRRQRQQLCPPLPSFLSRRRHRQSPAAPGMRGDGQRPELQQAEGSRQGVRALLLVRDREWELAPLASTSRTAGASRKSSCGNLPARWLQPGFPLVSPFSPYLPLPCISRAPSSDASRSCSRGALRRRERRAGEVLVAAEAPRGQEHQTQGVVEKKGRRRRRMVVVMAQR